MARFIFPLIRGVTGSLIKWTLVFTLWIGSIFFVAASALALDAISDVLSGFKGIPTPYLDQKKKVKKQESTIEAQKKTIHHQRRAAKKIETDLKKQKADVKKHGNKVARFASKMAARNVADAGTSLIPFAGGFMAVTFSVADVYAACELVTMQNDLEKALHIDGELSDVESVCVTSVQHVDELGQQAEVRLAEMKETTEQVSATVGEWSEQIPSSREVSDYMAEQMCRFAGSC